MVVVATVAVAAKDIFAFTDGSHVDDSLNETRIEMQCFVMEEDDDCKITICFADGWWACAE